ncbi:PLP-dependent aspartate aminotransferase family protein [Oceanicaulis sp. MMSF_3324]|uniref:trans-sulfuration enzyme family protein n=1 Tax=Oceanicaulis sp. MMSF_3324 TaxID=3046702 RepID=UPI00274005FF|nr:PLP-dependent aspartate aminotransferase family protein [Oceanicaulis sp. MMSF_3324]
MTEFRTRAVRAGIDCDPGHGAVVAPVQISSAYRRADPAQPGAFDYARTGQPGRAELATALAALEGASGAVVASSGMAAIDLVLNLLPNGARLICAHDCYGGTRRLMDARSQQRGFDLVYVDCTDDAALEAALWDGADLVFLETPSNPRLRLTDLRTACVRAKAAGAITVVDNTVLSPALQRPIELGADLVVSSLTKIINGHSDMVGGVVCAADPDHVEQLGWWANAAGAVGGAFDAFLVMRGLRTLPVRAKAQSESALDIAKRLAAHPKVARVDYPGLEDHPGHAIAKAQQDGFGPLMSLELKGGAEAARRFVLSLELFILAQSLGGVESLCAIPATMTHAAMTPEAREEAGVADGLVRLSVGLEAADDLWADLEQALDGL